MNTGENPLRKESWDGCDSISSEDDILGGEAQCLFRIGNRQHLIAVLADANGMLPPVPTSCGRGLRRSSRPPTL